MVEDVEELRPDLESDGLGDLGVFAQPKVGIDQPRTVEEPATRVADRPEYFGRERARKEEDVRAARRPGVASVLYHHRRYRIGHIDVTPSGERQIPGRLA